MSNGFGEKSRLWVSFSISHFKGDPDQITKILDQNPVRVLTKGQLIPKTTKVQRFNLWTMRAESKKFDLEKQMDVMIKQLRHFKRLKSKIGKFEARVTAVLEVVGNDTRPSISLTPLHLRLLGEMDLPFSVDYYFFELSVLRSQLSTAKKK
ncbi:MAG: DUF4279 domain-containing protein [Bdellovibrionales bacterium]|nr:DUF4279 domain-containing protein [Bdellovibrionales bacterium]